MLVVFFSSFGYNNNFGGFVFLSCRLYFFSNNVILAISHVRYTMIDICEAIICVLIKMGLSFFFG